MSKEDEAKHYTLGEPRSFGDPPAEPTDDSIQKMFERYSSLKSQMRVFHGQDPTINMVFDVMRRDRFLSAFPDAKEGAVFLDKVSPAFLQECLGKDVQSEKPNRLNTLIAENKDRFFGKLLFDFFTGQEGIEMGGQEMAYISLKRPPVEQSYEYVGEKFLKTIRSAIHEDKDPKTKAFFGWVGRHVMKKVCPETDFSLDRHRERVDEEKSEFLSPFKKLEKVISKRKVKGKLTLDKCYEFFDKVRSAMPDTFPSIFDAPTPLENLTAWYFYNNGFLDSLPAGDSEKKGSQFYNRSFAHFSEYWQREVKGDPSTSSEFLKLRYPDTMRDIVDDPEKRTSITSTDLLLIWFKQHCIDLQYDVTSVIQLVENFNITYFRFIGNRHIAEGYAFAEEHIDQILANLPEVLQMSEEEIQSRFMQGEAKILSDEWDSGKNSSDDEYYEEIEDRGLGKEIIQDKEEIPPIVLTDEERQRTDEDWLYVIADGPNRFIYEKLFTMSDIFSEEEWRLGVTPLFFGNSRSDMVAEGYFNGNIKEMYERFRVMDRMDVERERIRELKEGIFVLPKTSVDLLTNAKRQIQRLEKEFSEVRESMTVLNMDAIQKAFRLKERIVNIEEVRDKILPLIIDGKLMPGESN